MISRRLKVEREVDAHILTASHLNLSLSRRVMASFSHSLHRRQEAKRGGEVPAGAVVRFELHGEVCEKYLSKQQTGFVALHTLAAGDSAIHIKEVRVGTHCLALALTMPDPTAFVDVLARSWDLLSSREEMTYDHNHAPSSPRCIHSRSHLANRCTSRHSCIVSGYIR